MKQIRTADAIKGAGSQVNLAEMLGVSRQCVNQFGEYVPSRHAETAIKALQNLKSPSKKPTRSDLNLGWMIERVLNSGLTFDEISAATGYKKTSLCLYVVIKRPMSQRRSTPQEKLIDLYQEVTAKECAK